ncbi:hypothetical protein Bpfe_017927 [Biomphalaria pfeifferi]|uniref:Uncharacterized protein n=1 Tax=Biomphalaria pfeifferi TaxID=112525 RepID=A0AAD8BEK3_BIOPF|nr:hypothetical protein Bpfe_017927 [Biomphalaria pfeifferi]
MTNTKNGTKSTKVLPYVPKYKSLTFKVKETVLTSQPSSIPINLASEKEKFIRTGLAPHFEVKDQKKLTEIANKAKNQIRFNLLAESEHILELVRDKYGDADNYLEHAYGPRITTEEATPMLLEYIEENALSESLKIHWCDNLACSAKMVWRGPLVNANRPERRKYSLWISSSDENNYLRESGIRCLMDHEIGTHFFRMFNDGFQPWFSHRSKFGLRNLGSFENMCNEEGLASINTVLRGRAKFLWGAAFTYYAACKSVELSFKDLFDHLGRYTSNIDYRWKQVMRVKRGLVNPNDLGGLGNDQCYFEGAVSILQNVDNIDFHLLMSGKVCIDELDRIKRVVRKDFVKLPKFMQNITAYKNTLKKICTLNGLNKVFPIREPPSIYMNLLSQKKSLCKKKVKKVSVACCSTDNSQLKTLSNNNLNNDFDIEEIDTFGKAGELDNETKHIFFKQIKAVLKSKDVSKNGTILKDSKVQKKASPKGTEELVESFELSERFANKIEIYHIEKRKEETSEAVNLVEKICTELSSLDEKLEEGIQKLQNIVKSHQWSSNETGYKEELMSIICDGNKATCIPITPQTTSACWEEISKISKKGEKHSTKHSCKSKELSSRSDNIICFDHKTLSTDFYIHNNQDSLPAIISPNLAGERNLRKSSSSAEELPQIALQKCY